MAYASWSVVFGEQPSAAKWNILGTNDASFNDGTGIDNDVITDTKLVYGKIYRRQGGSATDWSTQGTNNYSYDTTNVIIQTGIIAGSGAADVTVTFPQAFAQKPLVQATMNSAVNASGMAIVVSVTTTTCVLRSFSHDGNRYVDNIAWLAIGQ